MIDIVARFIAIGFGAGLLPYAPGTWGSILGFFLTMAVYALWGGVGVLVFILTTIALGYWSCTRILPSFIDSDPSEIVIDEIAGMALTLGLIFAWNGHFDPWDPILAFGLFRAFDILKPPPISWVETWSQQAPARYAFGIMADDLLAAVMGMIIWIGIHTLVTI